MCKSYSCPIDIVASNKKPGRGTKGIREPKKFTSAKIIYPSPTANGKISVKSINKMNFRQYLFKTNYFEMKVNNKDSRSGYS